MLRRQGRAVHLVREDGARLERLSERQAPLVPLLDASLDTTIERREDDVHGVGRRGGFLEQIGERHPRPASRPDRLHQPRLADGSRLEKRPPIARAFHRGRELDPRAGLEVVQGEREWTLDRPFDLEPPGGGVDERHVVVDEQVVQPDRRDRPAQRLERHRVVPRRQAELVEGDSGIRRHRHATNPTPEAWPGRAR